SVMYRERPVSLKPLTPWPWVLERCIAPFPGFVEDVREQGLFAVQCGVITSRQPGANRPISLPCKIIASNKVLVDVCINLPATQHVRQASADAAASMMGLAELLKPNGAEVVEANRSESKMPRGGLRRRRGPASRKA
ncbi:MAG: hypothetical protein Q8Q74_21090, partial [Polaromonas sp.]|nr:hypothetical protein [Polaromonas sp.]